MSIYFMYIHILDAYITRDGSSMITNSIYIPFLSEMKLQPGGGLHPSSPEGEYSKSWLKRLAGKDIKTRRTRKD